MADETLSEPEWGPAMSALTEKQRRFVLAMAADPFGNATDWARAAGYSDVKEGAKVRGHGCMHSPKVEAAVLEFSRSMLGTVGPILATQVMLRAAANPKGKNRLRAAEMIANRVGLHEVQEVHVRRTDETLEAKVVRLKQLAAALGVDPAALIGVNAGSPKLIEGKVVDA